MHETELISPRNQPVTILRDPERPGWIRAELDGAAVEWTTDPDETPREDVADYNATLKDCQATLLVAVRMEKLVQSVRQALSVSYALRHSTTVTEAWTDLALDFELDDVSHTEGALASDGVRRARTEAHELVAAQLRAHGWRRHGHELGEVGNRPDGWQVLNLDTGRFARVETFVRTDATEDGSKKVTEIRYWADENGLELYDDSPGHWWFSPRGSRELPWDPWEMEAHLEARHRDEKRTGKV